MENSKNTPFSFIKLKFENDIKLISIRGPEEGDYPLLITFFSEISTIRKADSLGENELLEARNWFNGAMSSTETLQGHVCVKPRGYDGDFEMIDKIYTKHTSENPIYKKWDEFFHKGDAPIAVRNRKEYFKEILNTAEEGSDILNLACGSCRDIFEFGHNNKKKINIHNVDLDDSALAFAKNLNANQSNINIEWTAANIFKFVSDKKYDIIWSAGLFDYFDDKTFVRLLERFSKNLKEGGKMIIGNFSTSNSSKNYMEFGNWNLNYRDAGVLKDLGSSIPNMNIKVEHEQLKLNLFLILESPNNVI